MLNFSQALKYLKLGKKIQRKDWIENNQYIVITKSYPVNGHLNPDDPYNELPEYNPDGSSNITQGNAGQMLTTIIMKIGGDSKYWGINYSDYIPWSPSIIDILADDWQLVHYNS